MNWKLFSLQSVFISVGVGLSALSLIPSLSSLEIPIIGGLTCLYLVITFHRNPFKPRSSVGHDTPSMAILITVILLLILSTGKLDSLLFFLLYFLLFSISFVLVPETVFLFIAEVLLLFFFILFPDIDGQKAVQLGSLLLFTPLAYFFGKTFQAEQNRDVNETVKITSLINTAEQIKSDVSEILLRQQAKLQADDLDKLQDVVEQSNTVEDLAKR